MEDLETRSMWQQATGEAFEGPLEGKRLKLLDFLHTTWGEWRAQHPHTLAMTPERGYEARYANMVLLMETASERFAGTIRDDSRLPQFEQIVGIEVDDRHKAYPIARLKKHTVVNDQVGSTPILLTYVAASDTTRAFSRLVRGRTLTFRPRKPGSLDLVDSETGSTWTARGECIAGQLKGTELDSIPPLPSFWFSWAAFFPDTEIFAVK